MKKRQDGKKTDNGIPLLLSIILVFCILGVVVFSVARKINKEMSISAIQNLSESLDLIQCTLEAILNKEAEYQKIIAQEAAKAEDLEEFILSYQKSQTMVKVSLIFTGEEEGISNTGEVFSEEELDFSLGGTTNGLQI